MVRNFNMTEKIKCHKLTNIFSKLLRDEFSNILNMSTKEL